MLKIIAAIVLAFALLWGGAYVTDLIPSRHWAGAPAFLTFYIACCGCCAYAVVAAVKWHTARTESLRDLVTSGEGMKPKVTCREEISTIGPGT